MVENIIIKEEVENKMNKMMDNYDSNPNISNYLYKNDDSYLTDCSAIISVRIPKSD